MRRCTALLLLTILWRSAPAASQLTNFDRQRGFMMLDAARDDIRKNYFDSRFGGVDVAAAFDTAHARIGRATALGRVLGDRSAGDELILPSGADLPDRRDPVPARALSLLGVNTTPEQAGRLTWALDK